MHALSGEPSFPYCLGFIQPNFIISQLVGKFENNILVTYTLHQLILLNKFKENDCAAIILNIIKAIQYNLGILHNDIKANNIMLHSDKLKHIKIIDFGKSTMISKPVIKSRSKLKI